MISQIIYFARSEQEGYLCFVTLALLFWVSWHIDDFAVLLSTMEGEEKEE